MSQSRRRLFLLAVGAACLSAILPTLAQQAKMPRIGFIAGRSRPVSLDADAYGGFVRGLRELGYVEGKNVAIEWRFADGNYQRLPELIAELVRLKVDVILAAAAPAAVAAKQGTSTIPIVIGGVGDPVGIGLITSLSRPGGNVTGVSNLVVDLSSKNLELLTAMVPKLSRVAVLVNPSGPITPLLVKQIQPAAKQAGISVSVFEAGNQSQVESAFSAALRARAGALIVAGDPYFFSQAREIAELAARSRLPAIYPLAEHVEAGGLMSYGTDQGENYRRAATYVDKILKGAKPADLPVEQPMKFEFIINRKAANSLGLKIPQELLLQADRVIE
jgi:putative ABC transport system substrate-binding protein